MYWLLDYEEQDRIREVILGLHDALAAPHRRVQDDQTFPFVGRKDRGIASTVIEALSPEGGLVCDPFAGSGTFMYSALTSSPVSVTLPLLSVSSEMTPGIKWEDMLAEQQKDYSVGNFDFKRMFVHVECDPFQNIFLSCTDLKGNRKVKQII